MLDLFEFATQSYILKTALMQTYVRISGAGFISWVVTRAAFVRPSGRYLLQGHHTIISSGSTSLVLYYEDLQREILIPIAVEDSTLLLPDVELGQSGLYRNDCYCVFLLLLCLYRLHTGVCLLSVIVSVPFGIVADTLDGYSCVKTRGIWLRLAGSLSWMGLHHDT